jgi:LuxR family maltose regulon positive regulatory protein
MARRRIPRVIDDYLQPLDEIDGRQPPILLDSPAWYSWLDSEAAQSFAFRSSQVTLTVRREQQHGNWYWYAYRTQQGQLRKAYLGKPEKLTRQRLDDVAATLAADTTTPAQQPHTTNAALIASPSESATRQYKEALLATKLFIPPPISTLLARPRLSDRLTAGISRPLTLVSAPIGWGKTTLLSAWRAEAKGSAYPLAWISLDAGDNDPVRFWSYFISALSTLHVGVDDTALALLYPPQPVPMESVLTSLLNELALIQVDTILVLDDYHVIENQSIHQALTFLLQHLPPWLHLVISTRIDPPLPLARLRVRGALTEIRAADLRFTSEEATTFLTRVMGLPLSVEQVAALEARTEGWIAGLQLAALSAQGRPAERLGQFVEAFTGSSRYVLEYLVEEVLQQQPEDIQHFLLHTSMLDRLSGPLCNAILIKQESQRMLEYLERANLFIVSLDDEQRWFRYHHLFADVLRNRLQHLQPRLVLELHRRASAWYEQHEMVVEAVQHALAAHDFEHAARLIEQHAQTIANRGQVHMVLSWLNALPDALVRSRPLLCISHADVLLLTNHLEAAEVRLREVEAYVQTSTSTDQVRSLQGQVAAIRAIIARYYSGNLSRCVSLAQQALELLPETEVLARSSATVNAAHAYLVSGDVTPATERLVEAAIVPARGSGDLSVALRSITLLARLQVLQGRLRRAAATYKEAVQVVPEHGGLQVLSSSPAYSFGLGDVLREWNELEAAERQLADGMDLSEGKLTVDAGTLTLGYISMARLQQTRGEHSSALATLDAFAQLANQRHFVPHLVSHGAAVQAQIELAQGNLEAAIRWADTSGLSTDDELSYPYEREYMTLARLRIAQGRNDPAGAHLQDALYLLDRLLQDAQGKARMGSALEILVLRALALYGQGDQQGALTTLERALVRAEPEGYIRLFIDEGEPMLTLLSKLFATGYRARGYLQILLAACNHPEGGYAASSLLASAQTHPKPVQPLLDPLSERELEVMSLLAGGASNYEIGEQLVVAISTVKRHVSNIFSKLSVSSRTQAVARAREIGLL